MLAFSIAQTFRIVICLCLFFYNFFGGRFRYTAFIKMRTQKIYNSSFKHNRNVNFNLFCLSLGLFGNYLSLLIWNAGIFQETLLFCFNTITYWEYNAHNFKCLAIILFFFVSPFLFKSWDARWGCAIWLTCFIGPFIWSVIVDFLLLA